jgi:hypothetical protein
MSFYAYNSVNFGFWLRISFDESGFANNKKAGCLLVRQPASNELKSD